MKRRKKQMAEEKKVQEGETQGTGSTVERSTNKISELLAQIMQLIEKCEPNKEEVDEFIKSATENDAHRIMRLRILLDMMLEAVVQAKIETSINNAKASGMSPMDMMTQLQHELGEVGIEMDGVIGVMGF
jgi:hypothetical protein